LLPLSLRGFNMKKITTIILLVLLAIGAVFMSSCSPDLAPDGEPIPDGMVLASNMSVVDYAMFVPEGWIIDLQTGITMAHASLSDLTTVQMSSRVLDGKMTDLDSWWAQYKQEIADVGAVELVTENEKAIIDGIAAKKSVYKITVSEKTYKCIIIGVVRNGKVYELLYNSIEDLKAEDGGPYSTNMKGFESVLGNIRFTDKLYPVVEEGKPDKNAPEGMKLASDTDIVDYSLYVPNSWIIDVKTGNTLAHVSDKDRSSIQVGQWNLTESIKNFDTWWKEYKTDLERVGEITVTQDLTDATVNNIPCKRAEYTVKVAGGEYKCLVNAIIRKNSVYVIVYTSTADGYATNLRDVNRILESFKFN